MCLHAENTSEASRMMPKDQAALNRDIRTKLKQEKFLEMDKTAELTRLSRSILAMISGVYPLSYKQTDKTTVDMDNMFWALVELNNLPREEIDEQLLQDLYHHLLLSLQYFVDKESIKARSMYITYLSTKAEGLRASKR